MTGVPSLNFSPDLIFTVKFCWSVVVIESSFSLIGALVLGS